jgi:hypothetical protein
MATPNPIKAIPPAHFAPHQELRGCATAIVEFAVMAAFVVILLALIGMGSW